LSNPREPGFNSSTRHNGATEPISGNSNSSQAPRVDEFENTEILHDDSDVTSLRVETGDTGPNTESAPEPSDDHGVPWDVIDAQLADIPDGEDQ
jgi:hypothetical protein